MPKEIEISGYRVAGGPYKLRPKEGKENWFTVNMAAEIPDEADFRVECEDFQIPDPDLFNMALARGVLAMESGKHVYAGCFGGIGRTGMYLAAMAKVSGEKDPVGFVRRNYDGRAVETKAQMIFIGQLQVEPIFELMRKERNMQAAERALAESSIWFKIKKFLTKLKNYVHSSI